MSKNRVPLFVWAYPFRRSPIHTKNMRIRTIFSLRKLLVQTSDLVDHQSSPPAFWIIGRIWGMTYIMTIAIESMRKKNIIMGYVMAFPTFFLSSSSLRRSSEIERNTFFSIPVCSPASIIAISFVPKKSGSFLIAIERLSPLCIKKRRFCKVFWKTHFQILSEKLWSEAIKETPPSRRFATDS